MPKKRSGKRRAPGTGSVQWSKQQKRWVGAITIGKDEDGKQVRRVIVGPRGDNSNDARLGLEDRLAMLARTERTRPRVVNRKDSLAQYLTRWLEQRDDLSEAARVTYKWAIESHIIPAIGDLKIANITRDRVKSFYASIRLGKASIAKIRQVLHAALQDALIENLIHENPAAAIKRTRSTVAGSKEIAAWSPVEAKRFLKAAQSSEYYALFLLSIVGAMGPAELFGLRWGDIDLKRRSLSVRHNLTEVRGKLIFKSTKTKARERYVALPRAVVVALTALKRRKMQRSDEDFVFTARRGGPISRTRFRKRIWIPLLEKAKVKPITLYGLRHSSASLMAAMGIPLLVASRTMGHRRIGTTADRYTHLFAETGRLVADKFDIFLKDL